MLELDFGSVWLLVVEFIFQFTSNWWKRPNRNCSPQGLIMSFLVLKKGWWAYTKIHPIYIVLFFLIQSKFEIYWKLIHRLSNLIWFKFLQNIIFDLLIVVSWYHLEVSLSFRLLMSSAEIMHIYLDLGINFQVWIDPGGQEIFS